MDFLKPAVRDALESVPHGFHSRRPGRVTVPDVVGMSYADASFALIAVGLSFDVDWSQQPSGHHVVRSQSPAGGDVVRRRKTVVHLRFDSAPHGR